MNKQGTLAGLVAALGGMATVALAPTASAAPPAKGPVKVFILAGQSNMQGQASLVTLAHQIKAERTKKQFAHLHDGNPEQVSELVTLLEGDKKQYRGKEKVGDANGSGGGARILIDVFTMIWSRATGFVGLLHKLGVALRWQEIIFGLAAIGSPKGGSRIGREGVRFTATSSASVWAARATTP